ncbi:hypothetical protein KFK09_012066 [Dendrobium nobile]|uniref:Uncharacterized protein n=1 Tax=Dendrobium nobile TaxID=94219 RepID=A0A8T3BEJ6_DENNO|nr:hypothetical protein KFK09_012066 [Dendrobium nobile]
MHLKYLKELSSIDPDSDWDSFEAKNYVANCSSLALRLAQLPPMVGFFSIISVSSIFATSLMFLSHSTLSQRLAFSSSFAFFSSYFAFFSSCRLLA